jgi:P-type E1-E2 ATPase
VTAVEDLLQEDVQKSIRYLRKAGIKVWMLTGDKLETAKSISISSGLFNPNLDKIYTI